MEAHKIRTVRLYLQSRKIDGSDDDDDLLSSAFDHDLNQEGLLIGPHLERQSLQGRINHMAEGASAHGPRAFRGPALYSVLIFLARG